MSVQPATSLPPLESGDRLNRSEFERRYQAMPQVKKAELVEGIVYVASPVRAKQHGQPHARIVAWLGWYVAATPSVDFQDNATVRLDAVNEPQPDALLRLEPEAGGRSRISEDDYIEGAPELIVEIAASSASYDLGDKLAAYCRNQVQEYIVWEKYENRIYWYSWQDGRYELLQPDARGVFRSQIFPGLWLDGEALKTGNLAQVLTVLQQGLETPTHANFVNYLRQSQ